MDQHLDTSRPLQNILSELWVCSFSFQQLHFNWTETSPHQWRDGTRRRSTFGRAGREGKRAGLLSGGNKYCRHQWEMIHLFNVPFPKWNPRNPTDMATAPCISPLWNLIRAKTVYQCLEPDIYWKWPLVKVIAEAWRGFLMSLWSFSIAWANKTQTSVLMEQYRSAISWETGSLRGLNFQTIISVFI